MNRLLFTILLLMVRMGASAQVETYIAPQGAELNSLFEVSIGQGGRTWQSPVYKVQVDRVDQAQHNVEASGASQFSFGGTVTVHVRYNGDSIKSVRIRPLSRGIRPEVNGRDISFTLSQPENLSVEVNGDIYHDLQLFANPMEELPERIANLNRKYLNKPQTKPVCIHRPGLIYFGPGIHSLEGDTLSVPSNTTVYVAGGTVLKSHLLVKDAANVRILGRGLIDYHVREAIYVKNSRRVEVEGLLMTQLPVGNSDSVRIRNVKVISYYGWGDGLNVFASSHVSYDRCFARTSDDCTTVYATRKGFTGSSRHICMERSVLWADVAHPIFIGLHGNVEQPDTIEHLVYRDIDILEQAERQVDYQGCMAIGAGDENTVRDVLFENIRVENIRCGQLVNIRTTWNRKYCKAPGRLVEDVRFRNISYTGSLPNLSILAAYDAEHCIRNITFENLTLNGTHIADDMEGKPAWYKTSDFANMYVGENVSGVRFE